MRVFLEMLLTAFLSGGALARAGEAPLKPAPLRSDVSSVEVVVSALEACPPWTSPNSDVERVLSSLTPLARLSDATLRAGIERFVARRKAKQSYDIASMGKPFILNRILFAVPDRDIPDLQFFGGWEHYADDTSGHNPMWPLSVGKDHKLRLTGKFGGYSGPYYRALQEFDYFLRRFGRRAVSGTRPDSEPGGSANRGQPIRSDTNRTSVAAGPGRLPVRSAKL